MLEIGVLICVFISFFVMWIFYRDCMAELDAKHAERMREIEERYAAERREIEKRFEQMRKGSKARIARIEAKQ